MAGRNQFLLFAASGILIVIVCMITWRTRSLEYKPIIANSNYSKPPPNSAQAVAFDQKSDRDGGVAVSDISPFASPRSFSSAISKKLPLQSAGRAYGTKHVIDQSVPEMVLDLGNQAFLLESLADELELGLANDVATWQVELTRSVRVLRLIEEGRANPNLVRPALDAALEESLGRYNIAQQNWRTEWPLFASHKIAVPPITDNDPYYQKNHKYEDAIVEFERLHAEIYSCFYVAANISSFTDSELLLLQQWINMPKDWRYDCVDMNLWLVDAATRGQSENHPLRKVQERLLQTSPSNGSVTRAKWNAGWELDSRFIKAAGVNVREIPTIQVRQIKGVEALSESEKRKILESFAKATM